MRAGGPSPEYRAALAQFPKGIAVPGDTYDVVRAKFKPAHGHDPGPDIATEPATLGGVAGVWVSLRDKPAQPGDAAILFLHGGALVSCHAREYPFFAAWFVRATGLR
ncbi:MAG TPA: hypothetical protein VII78_20750, partial [Myxococcota bacterium]